MFNSFSAIYFISNHWDIKDFVNLYVSIPGGVVVFGGHLFYFYYRQRFLRISEKYKEESKKTSIIGLIVIFLYIILTLIVFFKFVAPTMGGMLK